MNLQAVQPFSIRPIGKLKHFDQSGYYPVLAIERTKQGTIQVITRDDQGKIAFFQGNQFTVVSP